MPLHQVAEDMPDQDVGLLNSGGTFSGDDQADIDHVLEVAAFASGEPDRCHLPRPRGLDSAQKVRTATGCRDGNQQVAAPADGLHLAGENSLEAAVVPDRRQGGGVSGKSDRGNPTALSLKAPYQLGCKVLAVRGAPAVSCP